MDRNTPCAVTGNLHGEPVSSHSASRSPFPAKELGRKPKTRSGTIRSMVSEARHTIGFSIEWQGKMREQAKLQILVQLYLRRFPQENACRGWRGRNGQRNGRTIRKCCGRWRCGARVPAV